MQNKGFTLIELLVVIAIIGILAGIIVVSMGTAQKQANDAKIQATMNQMRTAAQIYYINNSNRYVAASAIPFTSAANSACTLASTVVADTNFNALCTSADSVAGTLEVVVGTDGAGWCAVGQLTNVTTEYWCVDSAGHSKKYTADPATCDATTPAWTCE
ncbi:MAG: prepilin-type N-terminal cleavage/methylation domain-containing protein [Candidatus Paceibacterota bacterium]